MTTREFTLEIDLATSPTAVRAFLLDLDNLAPLHPLIESIELLDSRPERPAARRYRVVDQIPIGPFRMRTVYTAELEGLSAIEVCGRAWQSPGITLETRYRLSPWEAGTGEPGTHLVEHVRIQAPFGLGRFVSSQAASAHAATLAEMKRLLEMREAAPACEAASRGGAGG
jgi:hypothetical protein